MLREIVTKLEEANKGYDVTYGTGENVNIQTFKTPKEAITQWVKAQTKDPMGVSITSENDKDAKDLYNWVFNNLDEYTKIITKQKAYKTNYLYKEVQAVNLQKMNFVDGLHPFTVG